MAGRFTAQFLGTGTSVGVPLIGCICPVCTSSDPRDTRFRSSLYVSLEGRGLVIDTGPDFRTQCLKWQVPRVDAVFITHLHADHIFGFDDLRRFNTIQNNQVISCYAGAETLAGMRNIFPYIAETPHVQGLYRPLIRFCPVQEPFECLGAKLTPLPVVHGNLETYGLRIDFDGRALAYLPDVHEIPVGTLDALRGLDVLILNMLRQRPHPTHLALEQSLAYVETVAPKQTFFTHLSHDLRHAELLSMLPPHIAPAYDGQCVVLEA